MLIVWGTCHASGQTITHDQDLLGSTAMTVLGGSHLAGLPWPSA
ncbi:hypothetical protein OZK63_19835 [Streptomyces sp. UMAF16]|nr:hypothetical protein [Streptomyces sp. UMAF16]